MLNRTFGKTAIEELDRQFFSVSCDLVTGELVVHRTGMLVETVGASMSLPGVLAPVASDGQLLVDGGVLNNLPVGPMAVPDEGPVIAVDVTAQFRPPDGEVHDRAQWLFRTRGQSPRGSISLPNLKETLVRAIGIGSVDAVMEARRQADLLIVPETGAVGILEFRALDRMLEAGRDAARAALEAQPALVD
jgi:NTE family protein